MNPKMVTICVSPCSSGLSGLGGCRPVDRLPQNVPIIWRYRHARIIAAITQQPVGVG